MKNSKKLVIVLLVLAIFTAVSAGTLAIYTSTIDNVATTTVTAKKFVFQQDASVAVVESVKVAPGEDTAETLQADERPTFVLQNYQGDSTAEVPMNVSIMPTEASLNAVLAVYPTLDVVVTCTNGAGAVVGTQTWNANNKANVCNMNKVFTANQADDITCRLTYVWHTADNAEQNARDRASMEAAAPSITMSVIATQNTEETTAAAI